jgi:hypothetical protein
MVKRLVRAAALALLWTVLAPRVSGLGLAYGGGGALHFSPMTFSGVYGIGTGNPPSGTVSQVTSQVSAASLQFFDATYVLFQLGLLLDRGSTEPGAASTTNNFAATLTGLSLGVCAKYPFMLGPVTIFPVVGVEYVLNLTFADDKGDDLRAGLSSPGSSLNELWLKGGLGMDVFLGDLFVRPMVMGGFKPFGAASVSTTHPTGSLALSFSSYTIDVFVLFGYRL